MNIELNNEHYKFNIDRIIEYLKEYRDLINKKYNWNIEKPLDQALKDQIISEYEYSNLKNTDSFSQNVSLKEHINKLIIGEDDEERLKNYYHWIVKEWGGIDRDKERLYNEIISTKECLKNSKILDFENISSKSKVLSFIDIENYIIYDSRVAYALNWILLKTKASNKFFPIPNGRNSKLMAFNMETIINLYNKNMYKSKINEINKKFFIYNTYKSINIPKNQAYYIACELIKRINYELWDDEKQEHPFYTEMLLFAIADNIIIQDIINSIEINI